MEELFFGSRSTGSKGDFDQAVEAAHQIIYGGMSSLGVVSKQHILPETVSNEVQAIIAEEEKRVRGLLNSHCTMAKAIAEELLREEKLSGARFRELLMAS